METQNKVNNEKIQFTHYVYCLSPEQKKELIDKIRHHISYSNFYLSLRTNKFTKLQQFYLETILEQKFSW